MGPPRVKLPIKLVETWGVFLALYFSLLGQGTSSPSFSHETLGSSRRQLGSSRRWWWVIRPAVCTEALLRMVATARTGGQEEILPQYAYVATWMVLSNVQQYFSLNVMCLLKPRHCTSKTCSIREHLLPPVYRRENWGIKSLAQLLTAGLGIELLIQC